MKLVALVGMPGCGKSTIGAALAHRLGVACTDTDQRLQERLGCSIREYFERHGEAAFREAEAKMLQELVQAAAGAQAPPQSAGTGRPPVAGVLSTGGGMVLRQDNRQCLRAGCVVVYLRASPEQLWRRLRHDNRRPLLQVADPQAQLRRLHAQRDALYRECAHFSVDAHGGNPSTIVARIAMQLELSMP